MPEYPTTAEWVAALKSGKYKHGSLGYLRHIDDDEQERFCCLGVFLDMCDPDGWYAYNERCQGHRLADPLSEMTMPGEKVYAELRARGLDTDVLAVLNDRSGSFKTVIKKIEREANDL